MLDLIVFAMIVLAGLAFGYAVVTRHDRPR